MNSIPQVFELARISRTLIDASPCDVVLTYEEYQKYAKVYRELPESAKQLVDDMAYARRTHKKFSADS